MVIIVAVDDAELAKEWAGGGRGGGGEKASERKVVRREWRFEGDDNGRIGMWWLDFISLIFFSLDLFLTDYLKHKYVGR